MNNISGFSRIAYCIFILFFYVDFMWTIIVDTWNYFFVDKLFNAHIGKNILLSNVDLITKRQGPYPY
jgi:hypothetical protein